MYALILILCLAIQPFSLQGFFAVYGTIRDEEGRLLSSIRVSIVDENYQPIRTVFSDASGRFQLRGLRAGSYYLRVEPTGLPYEEFTKQIDLYSMTRRSSTTEEPTLEDIVLKRKKSRSAASGPGGVIFAQVVPPAAREEFERAASRIKEKNSEAGIDGLKKAIELFPDYFDALEMLGSEYVKLDQFENAVPILTRASAVNDKAGSITYALGFACLRLNRFDEAIEWFQKSVAQDSGNPNTHMMLGLAYGNLGQLDQAETALKKAYQLGKANAADAHLYLAGIYDRRGRYGDARRELELYLKEARGLKDKNRIKDMIAKMKAKETRKP